MSIHSFFSLLGGLALFLYGMQMMSTNLEAAAGSRMKQILERLTANRFLGVFVGAGITAIIQSSSATTVMVVGFVNSPAHDTQTGCLDHHGRQYRNHRDRPAHSPGHRGHRAVDCICRCCPDSFVKQKKVQFAGGIIAGLSILFLGME